MSSPKVNFFCACPCACPCACACDLKINIISNALYNLYSLFAYPNKRYSLNSFRLVGRLYK